MGVMTEPVRTFLRDGVAIIPVDPKLYDLTYFAAAWFLQWLDEPERVHKLWENLEMGLPDDPETGYLPRKGQKKHTGEGTYDIKDTFHFRLSIWGRLAIRGVKPGIYEAWLELCKVVLSESVGAMHQFAKELDRELPGYNFALQLEESWVTALPAYHRHVFRINRYRAVKGGMLAQDHRDRSLLSLQTGDSGPGLEGIVGNSVRAFRTREGQALIFAGKKLELITDGGIRAWRHRVRNHPAERLRWSGVCFGHSPTDLPEHTAKAAA